jgi:hypothetical protein
VESQAEWLLAKCSLGSDGDVLADAISAVQVEGDDAICRDAEGRRVKRRSTWIVAKSYPNPATRDGMGYVQAYAVTPQRCRVMMKAGIADYSRGGKGEEVPL